MTMFDVVGVGPDWIEIKRQKDEAVAIAKVEAEYEKAVVTARKALAKGYSIEDAADLSELSVDEVEALCNG